jgi:hypothetical protein
MLICFFETYDFEIEFYLYSERSKAHNEKSGRSIFFIENTVVSWQGPKRLKRLVPWSGA